MSKRTKYGDFNLSFIDLLLATLGVLLVLNMMLVALISPPKQNQEGVRKNADYVITMEWPTDMDCDVDLWVRDPQNNLASYRHPEGGLMYFERDDMGKRRSVYEIDGKEVIIDPDNKEFVTLRGVFPGEYIINAHVYSCLNPDTNMGYRSGTPMEVPLIVEIVRINPSFIVSRRIEMKMTSVWQEKTIIRFVMDGNKNIIRYKTGDISIRTNNEKAP
jgi:YD repeat-containing protein